MKFKQPRFVVKTALILAVVTLGFLTPNSIVPPSSGMSDDPVTLDVLRREVFLPTCATTSCHSSVRVAGGLVLDGFNAFGSIVDVQPVNEAARAAGKLLVVPGKPDESFLFQKITGRLGPDEGDQMPQLGIPLPPEKVEMVRQWILRGAPPSTTADIQLPTPYEGVQLIVPNFQVPEGTEVQKEYYTSLTNPQELRVTRYEILVPPGSHHTNFFAFQGGTTPPPDGTFRDTFDAVPFANWALRAGNQRIHQIWDLPPGVAFKFDPLQKVMTQIHFVNINQQLSPIGGMACINLHGTYDREEAPLTMGTMFGQNIFIVLEPRTTTVWDYGATFEQFGIEDEVKIAGVNGHFHWRGRDFEVRLWDGQNKNRDGSPIGCRPCSPGQTGGEFDRMGVDNRIYLSQNWDEPPFETYSDKPITVPASWGIVYRTTYVNNTNRRIIFGPHVETEEHSNVFIYFYPGPEDGRTLSFPLPSQR
jgi:hypothetical protein